MPGSRGRAVGFTDGSRVTADIVVLASGYRIELPFLGSHDLEWNGHAQRLHLGLSPRYDELVFRGLPQPSQGQWQLEDQPGEGCRRLLRAQTRAT